jgi:putative ABC transport system substrate-binding protein
LIVQAKEVAAKLVATKPDVLVTVGTAAVRALRDVTTQIPIVMAGACDPVDTGLLASLALPDGNITGISTLAGDFIPKIVSLLHETVPRGKRIALIC